MLVKAISQRFLIKWVFIVDKKELFDEFLKISKQSQILSMSKKLKKKNY